MALFGKKDKDSEEQKDTLDVKEAAASAKAPFPQNPPSQVQENEAFVNPFKEEQKQETAPSQQEDLFKGLGTENSSSGQGAMPVPDFSAPQQNPLGNNFSQSSNSPEEIKELIDETVEKIIEEKWDKVTTDVEKVLKWKNTVEHEIQGLNENLGEIKENFERMEKKIMSKINDYDKDILDIGSEIKALEKVFQKITPTLVNNVNELSKIAKTFRGGSSVDSMEDEEEREESNQVRQGEREFHLKSFKPQ